MTEIETTTDAPEPQPVEGDDPFNVPTEPELPQSDEESPKNDEVPT